MDINPVHKTVQNGCIYKWNMSLVQICLHIVFLSLVCCSNLVCEVHTTVLSSAHNCKRFPSIDLRLSSAPKVIQNKDITNSLNIRTTVHHYVICARRSQLLLSKIRLYQRCGMDQTMSSTNYTRNCHDHIRTEYNIGHFSNTVQLSLSMLCFWLHSICDTV